MGGLHRAHQGAGRQDDRGGRQIAQRQGNRQHQVVRRGRRGAVAKITVAKEAQGIEAFIRGIPKAELHLHIEGSLEPEMTFELARRHGVAIKFPSVEALRRAYDFGDLQSFLDLYYAGADVLRDEEDFAALTRAYMARARAD